MLKKLFNYIYPSIKKETSPSNIVQFYQSELQFGDILIISSKSNSIYDHAVIYVGDGRVFDHINYIAGYVSLDKYKHTQICVLRPRTPLTCEEQLQIINQITLLKDKKASRFIVWLWNFLIKCWSYLGGRRKAAQEIDRFYPTPSNLTSSQLVSYIYRYQDLIPIDYTQALCRDFLNSHKLSIVFKDREPEKKKCNCKEGTCCNK